jgi:hypothetical protein
MTALLKDYLPPSSGIPWTAEDSLFTIWIGINDVRSTFGWSNYSAVYAEEMVSIFSYANQLYEAGGAFIPSFACLD